MPFTRQRLGELARSDAGAIAFLALVVCVWFWPLLTGEQMGQSHVLQYAWPWQVHGIDPAAFIRSGEGDAASQFHPNLTLARDQILNGTLPLQTPFTFAGMPLLGDLQIAIFCPLTWLALPLGVEEAWGFIALLKLLTAGAGGYALARSFRV